MQDEIFPDKEHFGRKNMDISCAALYTSLKGQVDLLRMVLKEEGVRLNHIKPHGALYNLAAVDTNTAHVLIEVLKNIMLPVKLYVPYNSVIEKIAIQNNIPVKFEAFADRNYNDNGTLVSRVNKNAVIKNEEVLFKHVYSMITSKKVITISGNEIDILADTICVHGDNPEAVNLIKYLNKKLLEKGILIK